MLPNATAILLTVNISSRSRHVLASASVDQSVILWDLDEGQPHTTIKSFEEKVQSIEFHPTEPQNLLAGSCDGYVRLFDCRDPESECKKWKVEAEVEKVVWNPMNTSFVMVSLALTKVFWIAVFSIFNGFIKIGF